MQFRFSRVPLALDPEANGHAGADIKDIARSADAFLFVIPAQIDNPPLGKLVADNAAESVRRVGVYKAAVGDERNDALFAQPVRCPTKKPYIHVVQLRFSERSTP